jgi:8-oxo-dGTP pyrophosphatase MutT (NUDIX family)
MRQADRHWLRERLARPLPGHERFLRLSGYPRPRPDAVRQLVPPPRESAVLVLVYPKAERPHTLLMLRPDYPGVHGGQVSFPGGKREEADPGLEHTALREFREETGSALRDVELVGRLSEVYIPPSRTLVTPFVGWCEAPMPFAPDPAEVQELIEAPLDLLLRDDILKVGERRMWRSGQQLEVPYFDVHGHMVWGATALMIAELRELLNG